MGTEIDSSWENERLKERIVQLEAELANFRNGETYNYGVRVGSEYTDSLRKERDALAAIVVQQREALDSCMLAPMDALANVAKALALDISQAEAILAKHDAALAAIVKQQREALDDLASCMEGVLEGDYMPDSFTLQPARKALDLDISQAEDILAKRDAEALRKAAEAVFHSDIVAYKALICFTNELEKK